MAPAQSAPHGPAHIVDLFWRTTAPPRRGPRGSLSVERIVQTAVDIADAEGLDAVSMRRVAEGLGVTTMSLYRYVPGKDDLCELMLDHASGVPDTTHWPEGWRPRLETFARDMRALFRRRPWTLDVPVSGPPMGPNALAWMESALAALDGTGLSGGDRVTVLSVVGGFARHDAMLELSMSRAMPRTGVSPQDWGRAYGEALNRAIADGRYPTLAGIVQAGAFNGPGTLDDDFAAGLQVVLDGVAALIARRSAGSAGPD
jgi:AcrR family transcriptional regulator